MSNFTELGLKEDTIKSLSLLSIDTPTEIQEKAIPIILDNKNLIAQSETGTGKTFAFLLPLIEKIDHEKKEMQAIILAPTHELGIQINNALNDLKRGLDRKITSTSLVGSGNVSRQIERLKDKPHILVGSSGRVLDLIKKKRVTAHTIHTIVIDEGDKLLDYMNIEEVNGVLKACKRDAQKVLFSATLTPETLEVGQKVLGDCEIIHVKGENKVNENIEHGYFSVEERDKVDYLRKLVHATKAPKVIAFINNNYDVNMTLSKLRYHKINAEALHGSNRKDERKNALEGFRKGKVQVLVASDVAARGLDIKGVTHIINLDVPKDPKDYLHRVGRVGRAGETGVAYSLANYKEEKSIEAYKKKLKIEIPKLYVYEGGVAEVAKPKMPYKKKKVKKK